VSWGVPETRNPSAQQTPSRSGRRVPQRQEVHRKIHKEATRPTGYSRPGLWWSPLTAAHASVFPEFRFAPAPGLKRPAPMLRFVPLPARRPAPTNGVDFRPGRVAFLAFSPGGEVDRLPEFVPQNFSPTRGRRPRALASALSPQVSLAKPSFFSKPGEEVKKRDRVDDSFWDGMFFHKLIADSRR
jgi:hypothetical protein